ncbi:MAG: hypothetical protein CUN55_19260, partial [Phototrophicales bacterium]
AISCSITGSIAEAQSSNNAKLGLQNRSQADYALDLESNPSIESVRYREVVAATKDFLATLDQQQREAVLLPFEHPYRTRAFCYVLAQCKEDNVGLRMSQLNTTQKIALNKVLMKSYSSAGYSRAIQTMNREGLIEEMENAH